MPVKHWYLSPLLSQDDAKSLILKIEKQLPRIRIVDLSTEICFNVATDDDLSNSETETLRWLLSEDQDILPNDKSYLDHEMSAGTFMIEVGPRLTFTSPFSTNAVSIAHSAGLKSVQRIEMSRRYRFIIGEEVERSQQLVSEVASFLHDGMTEMIYKESLSSFEADHKAVDDVFHVPVMSEGRLALERLNNQLGLAMDDFDLDLYTDLFRNRLQRDPTNVECFDLSQSNSEHSRHWFFRGIHVIDGETMPKTLFQLVKQTQDGTNPNNTIAFSDNSSAIKGPEATKVMLPEDPTRPSRFMDVVEERDICFTAETHNFPTGVAPFPGATTGTGGRIRDVQSTGRGAHVVAGTAGYSVGNLHLPDYPLLWEERHKTWPNPRNLASPQEILIRASDGASDYGNKFGEPVLAGFARSFGAEVGGERIEWLKPIMFSGGIGHLPARGRSKVMPEPGMLLAKIGGPVYRIGVGGGAASSVQVHGDNSAERDFNAVQRGDAEMEQKMNRVVRACLEVRGENPVLSIHDQGAGGNGNVLKEMCEPAGALIDVQNFSLGDPTLNVLEIWGAEYQESNAVLLAGADGRRLVEAMARREKCPVDVVGEITGDKHIRMKARDGSCPVDLELEMVLGKMPQKTFTSARRVLDVAPVSLPPDLTLESALQLVLRLPAVASKRYLTVKVDRSVTGLVARQQCVGPLHTPLADVAVIAMSYWDREGAATAIGEQPLKLLLDPQAGARLCVAESLTNLVFAPVSHLRDVKTSCNWMWPAKLPHEAAALYDACQALSEVMTALGVGIDGGKDSLSMAARVKTESGENEVVKSPRCLVVSAYVRCPDITRVVTPVLCGGSSLFVVRFLPSSTSALPQRLGGSALATCLSLPASPPPDLDSPSHLARAFAVVQALLADDVITAGHDVSDGGLVTCLLEMAFAAQIGVEVRTSSSVASLFAEEPGLVLEVPDDKAQDVLDKFQAADVFVERIGRSLSPGVRTVRVEAEGRAVLDVEDLAQLMKAWEETSSRLDRLQCREECVEEEWRTLEEGKWPAVKMALDWPQVHRGVPESPRMAVLREEGSNGDRELAAAFHRAGFQVWDISMRDLQLDPAQGAKLLSSFRGLAFCGGFSYADVLGSAKGWAAGILCDPVLRKAFAEFRDRPDTFSLGICNGCQLMARLEFFGASVRLLRNRSGRFESRFPVVRFEESSGVFLRGMGSSQLGVWVAHGEGRFNFDPHDPTLNLVPAMRYVGPDGEPTDRYPFNPNGSQMQLAAVSTRDGRHLAMMPHPERSLTTWQWPWLPNHLKMKWNEETPWMKLFYNALDWCSEQQ